MRPDRPIRREEGSALVYVLWITLLLSVLMAGAALFARTQIIAARVEQTVLSERLALRSALDLVAYRGAIAGRAYFEGLPDTVAFGGYEILVERAPNHGRLDVNLADETAWMRLFQSLGAEDALARRLTDQVLDWRDSDTDPRPDGAEANAYSGSAKQIGNRAFFHIGELENVLDITPARLACMAPYLTVLGGTGPVQGAPLQGLELPARSDGMRVALRAAIVGEAGSGRALTGLAQFGASDTRPFEWVHIGADDGIAASCPEGAFESAAAT
ncbi:hypothetical protein DDZ18_03800 [Marinicauda salina]|uniref:T2SS protein K first SAM-like domain-containing protein n=1 Tax=Marinicauda salina TaxID=2135793 RepID=A0A2U2BXJ0_9PROT|nr:type II secretion system protein GspK [Marinicauda salina]PWE18726.1 hypothetical protein DDZ18_03800 [Marinicauda salina]